MKGMPSFGLTGDVIYEPMWISETYVPYTQRVMYVDPSGRGEDETSVCVGSFANGYIHIHELIGYPGGYEKNVLKKIAKLAREYNVNLIRVESNFGDAMYCQLLAPIVSDICGATAIEDFRVSGRKESRIISILEPVMAQHRLVIDKRTIAQEENQKQLTRIFDKRGALSKDDRVDCLASTVSYWEGMLSLDVEKVIESNRQRRHNDVVATWMNEDRRMGMWSEALSGAVVFHKEEKPVDRNKAKWGSNRRPNNRWS